MTSTARIVGVAIRTPDGEVHKLPAPNRHCDVIRLLYEQGRPTPIEGVQGFYDARGVFLRRHSAEVQARRSGQLTKARIGSVLTSEDLW